MSDPLIPFARRYRQFFQALEVVSKLPKAWQHFAAQRVARRLSPYCRDRRAIQSALRMALGLGQAQAEQVWQDWLDSHGRFGLRTFDYPALDAAWLANEVVVESPEVLDKIARDGGLFLTYHSHHQNIVACIPGILGKKTYAIAASEKGSPFAPYTGRWVRMLNGGSEAHFQGGQYLFTDELKTLLRGSKQALADGDVLICLCDFQQPGKQSLTTPLLGREISAATGTIQLALDAGVPIYCALLFPDAGRYRLRLCDISAVGDAAAVLRAYFGFLEDSVRAYPVAWQGWWWYHNLPVACPAPERSADAYRALHAEYHARLNELDEVYTSRSWRLTAPLRTAIHLTKRLLRR